MKIIKSELHDHDNQVPENFDPASFTHGIVAVNKHKQILHFVGYWQMPDSIAFAELLEELQTDETFGLTNEDFTLQLASPKIIKQMKKEHKKLK